MIVVASPFSKVVKLYFFKFRNLRILLELPDDFFGSKLSNFFLITFEFNPIFFFIKLNKNRQIKELKTWQKKMINYPIIFNNKNFSNINNMINSLEIVNCFLENDLKNAWIKIRKMPYSLRKIKYLMALLLPNSFVKRFI